MPETGMVVRCECNAKMCENANFFSVVVRCDANFDSIFASHSHFALFALFFLCFFHIFFSFAFFRTFFAFFSHFFAQLLLFGALTVKHGAKISKCEKSAKNAMRMRSAKCECDANAKCEMRMRCESGAMGLDKSANAKNFSHYHPRPDNFKPRFAFQQCNRS